MCNKAHLLFIDLDGFKPINDQLGHEAGDQALIEVARRLKCTVGKNDFIGRLGGDEFVVILTQTTDHEDALSMARTLISAISIPMHILSAKIPRTLGASIGIVAISPGARNSNHDTDRSRSRNVSSETLG
ncbi:diguanylate cyclase domain-containing protein [Paludibacterium denitrificans]|uniref:Diguanylate cyclase n=1 Tax=Paludibacterium denitrificans TaxID=2675226 RepID=A0A844GEZ6_9NEIS|nr:GGDEF domain-containing protein [Paludibacterium denitrificans]MTD34239.1 diguanylate cyclase [Paludibacterium denitrificans]